MFTVSPVRSVRTDAQLVVDVMENDTRATVETWADVTQLPLTKHTAETFLTFTVPVSAAAAVVCVLC